MPKSEKLKPVLPFDLDEPMAKLIAKHTPYPADEILRMIRKDKSIDLLLMALQFCCMHAEDTAHGTLRAKAVRRIHGEPWKQ